MFVVIFIILLIFALLDDLISKNLFVYLSGILLIIIAAFRGLNVGPDTPVYYQNYEGVISNNFEWGYTLIEKVFNIFHLPWIVFSLFIALLIICILIKQYKLMVSSVGLALLYYYSRFYINRDLNQIRSALAAIIILISFKYIVDHSFWKFVLVILIAQSIHSGAVIGLILYPLFNMMVKCNRKKLFKVYLLSLVLAGILSFGIGKLLLNVNINSVQTYLTNSVYLQGGKGLLNPVIILQVLISCTAVFLYSRKEQHFNYDEVALLTYMCSTIILILLSQYYTLAGRFSTLFATVEPVILLQISKNIKSKFIRDLFFTAFTVIVFYLINYSTGLAQNINYQFLF